MGERAVSKRTDFGVSDHGSIFLLEPRTRAARNWIDEHIADNAQFWGECVAVEHRYIWDLVEGIVADGYSVEAV